jgi:signal transduction histidine kinase
MDSNTALTRQSLLVAGAAAAVDCTTFAVCGAFGAAPVVASVVVVAIAVADLALAAAPRTAGVVALAQVALRLVAVTLLRGHGLPVRVADVGFLAAGYRAGAWLSGAASVVSVSALALGAVVADLLGAGPATRDPRLLLAQTVAVGVVPWLVGRSTAARGAYIADLEQRERLRRQEQRAALDRALADEREAIACDLHDVIAHHVSAIGIHAGAARLAVPVDPTAATASLAAVEASSRAAMVDLRRQLDLLHGRAAAGARQPGLADIEQLVTHVREAGLDVEVVTSGADTRLPESLDVIVFRIVQEMLTNALRHGDGTARLEVAIGRDRVTIGESNPVGDAARDPDSPRRGLSGIRRRADLFTGTVDHRVDDENRWHITVSLPIGGA